MTMRRWSQLAAAVLALSLVSIPSASAQDEGAGGDAPSHRWHLTVEYAPTMLVAGGWFGAKDFVGAFGGGNLGITTHNVMVDLSVPLAGYLRWHPRVGYSDYVASAGSSSQSENGARLEPFEFGVALPVYSGGGLHLEVEPTLSPLQMSVFSWSDNQTVLLLGAGIGVGLNVDYGPVRFVIKPVDLDVVYLSYSSTPSTRDGASFSDTQTGGNLMYRLGIAAGASF